MQAEMIKRGLWTSVDDGAICSHPHPGVDGRYWTREYCYWLGYLYWWGVLAPLLHHHFSSSLLQHMGTQVWKTGEQCASKLNVHGSLGPRQPEKLCQESPPGVALVVVGISPVLIITVC